MRICSTTKNALGNESLAQFAPTTNNSIPQPINIIKYSAKALGLLFLRLYS